MVLYFIGLGLYDEKDITLRCVSGLLLPCRSDVFPTSFYSTAVSVLRPYVCPCAVEAWILVTHALSPVTIEFRTRGLEAVKKCKRVYLEAYTSILLCDKEKLELYGRPVIVADREMVESQAETILEGAETEDVAFLVVGDPFGATTHTDIQLRAREKGVKVHVIHNASVMNTIEAFGPHATTHTDIQLRAREKGVKVHVIHNASVMNAIGACGLQLYKFGECISIVFFTETWRPDSFYDKILANKKMADDQQIVVGTMKQLLDVEFGPPLHSVVIPGDIHVVEQEMLEEYMLK
eukprot:gene8666-34117_t